VTSFRWFSDIEKGAQRDPSSDGGTRGGHHDDARALIVGRHRRVQKVADVFCAAETRLISQSLKQFALWTRKNEIDDLER
jgi:hypothetical protein